MLHVPELSTPPALPEKVIKCSYGIATGVGKSVTGFAHMVAHPLDTLVYPVSGLVYDASIIIAANYESPLFSGSEDQRRDFNLLRNYANSKSQVYMDSHKRMMERYQNAEKFCKDFANGEIETLSQVVTSIYLPGSIIKGVSSIRNLKTLGVANPPKFHTDIGTENIMPIANYKSYNIKDIRGIKDWDVLQYVITEDKRLIITPTTATKPFHRGKPLEPDTMLTNVILHSDIAGAKPVYAAGEFLVKDGKITKLNNQSGHYHPGGPDMGKLIEKVFTDNGYVEIPGIYADCGYIFGEKSIMTKNKTKPAPPIVINNDNNKPNNTPKEENKAKEEGETADEVVYEVFPCSGNFNLREFEEASKEVPGAIRQLEEIEKFDQLAPQTRERLLSIAEPLYQFGQIGLGISQIALMTGGHARTWKGIAAASQSMLSLAHGISAVAAAESLMSLAAVGGYVGIAVAGVGLAMSLFGNDGEDNGMEALFEGINIIIGQLNTIHSAIHDMHQDLIKIGKRLEEILVTKVLSDLSQINSKVDRLERITSYSFKELHGKELIDIIDTIKKDLCDEHVLTNPERRDYMRKLSTWIDHHSKSPLQTFIFKTSSDKRKILEILESSDFDIYCMLPLFVSTIKSFVPELGLDITNIPNIRVFSIACDVYLLAEKRYNMVNSKLTDRIISNYNNILSVIGLIQKLNVQDIIYRQYKHCCLMLGNSIRKYRKEYSIADKDPINNLIIGTSSSYLEDLLVDIELRYQLLKKLESLGCPLIQGLDSRNIIMKGNLSQLASIYDSAKDGNLNTFIKCLEAGVDPNVYNSWGMPIHYITKHCKYDSARLLHALFRYSEIVMVGGTKIDQGDTWGVGANPILHVMNRSKFGMAVLFCANGFDITDSDGRGVPYGLGHFNSSHCGNLYWWCESIGPTALVPKMTRDVMKHMNTEINVFNKLRLRKAYEHFKVLESGFESDLKDVELDALLLLTCVIGDLRPLKRLLTKNLTLKLKLLLPKMTGLGVTYPMIAAACNSVEALKYFRSLSSSSLEALSPLYPELTEINNNHCYAVAIIHESWDAADYIRTACARSCKNKDGKDQEQLTKISDGIKEYSKHYAEINKQQPVVKKGENNDKIVDYIKAQIEKINTRPKEVKNKFHELGEKCELFFNLISKHDNGSKICHDALKNLETAIKTQQIQKIIKAFNQADAVLRTVVKGYNLGSKIDYFIEELRSEDL